MFVRADRLLTEVNDGRFPKHAISFHWEGFVPHLVAYDNVDEQVVEIDLSRLDMTVSETRSCVGRSSADRSTNATLAPKAGYRDRNASSSRSARVSCATAISASGLIWCTLHSTEERSRSA
jgi:hypothetical protein